MMTSGQKHELFIPTPLTTYKLQYLNRKETNNKKLKVNLRIITQKLPEQIRAIPLSLCTKMITNRKLNRKETYYIVEFKHTNLLKSCRTNSSVQQHVKHKFSNNNEDKFRKIGVYQLTCDCKKKYTGHVGRNLTKYLKDIFFLLRITVTILSCLNICYKTATDLEKLMTIWKSYPHQKGTRFDTGEKVYICKESATGN